MAAMNVDLFSSRQLWELTALDAEFRSAVLKKQLEQESREFKRYACVARTCRQFAAAGNRWPGKDDGT